MSSVVRVTDYHLNGKFGVIRSFRKDYLKGFTNPFHAALMRKRIDAVLPAYTHLSNSTGVKKQADEVWITVGMGD